MSKKCCKHFRAFQAVNDRQKKKKKKKVTRNDCIFKAIPGSHEIFNVVNVQISTAYET